MANVTITERINAIDFDTLTQADFDFLKERALKSIRKANPDAINKETEKHNAEREQVLEALKAGPMTATQVSALFGATGSQKGTGLLKPLVRSEQNPGGPVVGYMDKKVKLFKLADEA